ncbi:MULTISPECIES: hypothetical protein [unclassified Bradyrhizobium]|nr:MULTISPECIES: hypothetical protein [unclassified Bradyrhizobium]
MQLSPQPAGVERVMRPLERLIAEHQIVLALRRRLDAVGHVAP